MSTGHPPAFYRFHRHEKVCTHPTTCNSCALSSLCFLPTSTTVPLHVCHRLKSVLLERGLNMSDMTSPPDFNSTPNYNPGGDPASAVKGPAIFLMVVGGIGILIQILALLFNLLGVGLG